VIDIGFNLDCILEKAQDNLDPSVACDTYKKLLETRAALSKIQKQLYTETKRLCLESAIAVRRENPGLNVAVIDATLKIGHSKEWMTLQPNYSDQSWELIDCSPDMRRVFSESLSIKTSLVQSSTDWAKSVAACFNVTGGTGIVMLEGKRSTIMDLCTARNELLPLKLPSRRSRGQQ
jgi:hypothetical protein